MKVALISNYEPDRSESMLRYGRMLESKLRERGYDVLRLHPPVVLGRMPLVRGNVAKWIRYIDKYAIAPWYLRWKSRDADVVHICDHSNAMYLWCAGRKAHAVTCHDLIAVRTARGEFPGIEVGVTGRLLQRWIAASLMRAQHVVCVSEKTEEDLSALAPQIRDKMSVVHHALNRSCAPANPEQVGQAVAAAGLEAGARYLLHVGNNGWYKNRAGAIRIFAELVKYPEFSGLKLLLAGRPLDSKLRDLTVRAGVEGSVVVATNVSDEMLRALYTGAQALLFPSLIEGFGWPVLEAQACGCPVITTNRAPMTEVAGDAAILIDPVDERRAAEIIREQWPRVVELRGAGFKNAAKFVDERMVEGYARVYAMLIDESRRTIAAR